MVLKSASQIFHQEDNSICNEPHPNQDYSFQCQNTMPSFKHSSNCPEDVNHGVAGTGTSTRTLKTRVSVGGQNNTQANNQDSSPVAEYVEPFIEAEGILETRISGSIILENLTSAVQKRIAPVLEVYTSFENKCIAEGFINKTQNRIISHTFHQLLSHIIPLVNSELRYQHSEPLAAVLLMFAWESARLPIKNFLKTIDSCTKKELGRVGTIRKCKAFSVLKQIKHQMGLTEVM